MYCFKNLYKAYKRCVKRKSNTLHAIAFGIETEKNLLSLQKELQNHSYFPGKSVCFVVKEPVIREIFAAPFRDRIVQHLIYEKIEPFFEKHFIETSCACRKNKGTHFGVKKLQKGIQSFSNNYKHKLWYLKMDIKGFFMNIDKNILFSLFSGILQKECLKDEALQKDQKELLWLIETIIFHDPTKNYYKKGQLSLFDQVPFSKSLFFSGRNKGLPIGNLTSQFFANVYLNPLDHFVKRILKCKQYVRYVDDFVLLANSREQCQEWEEKIRFFCKNKLELDVHMQKTMIQPVCNGIDFVGYRIFPRHILVRQKTVGKAKEKITNAITEKNTEKLISCANSYLGMFRHAHSFRLRKKIIENVVQKRKDICVKSDEFFSITKKLLPRKVGRSFL